MKKTQEEKIVDEIVTNAISQIRPKWESDFDQLRLSLSYGAPEVIEDKWKNFIAELLIKEAQIYYKETQKKIIEILEKSTSYGDSGYCGRCSFIVRELKKYELQRSPPSKN